jgi:phospholipase A1
MTKDVLVFVPGLLGSELWVGDDKIWPGSLWQGGFGFDDAHFQRLMNPNLEPRRIIESAAGVMDIYGKWLRAFRAMKSRGAPASMFSDSTNPPTLYTAPYDWRISLMRSAEERLAPVLAKAKADWGSQVAIHIVAHSLGGLLTRYYLQSGKFNGHGAYNSIKSFTTFGTPHNGAPVAVAAAMGKHKTNFLSLDQSRALANDPRYPALYQTFPDLTAPLVWKRGATGKLEPVSLADRQFATTVMKLTSEGLDKAKAFRESLEVQPIQDTVRCFLLIGTRYSTITHFSVSGGNVEPQETEDGGDGTVSIQGAYLPKYQVQFTGESHVDLIASGTARQTFQELFGADGLAAMLAATIGPKISVRDREVQVGPGSLVHARITGEKDFDAVDGKLQFERAMLPAGQTEFKDEDFKPVGQPSATITYRGPSVDAIAIKIPAPSMTGLYRLVLKRDEQTIALSPTFVVSP